MSSPEARFAAQVRFLEENRPVVDAAALALAAAQAYRVDEFDIDEIERAEEERVRVDDQQAVIPAAIACHALPSLAYIHAVG